MSALTQPKLFGDGIVDEVRRGWVLAFEGKYVRVHGRNSSGDFRAALADSCGRDLRPLQYVTIPSTHPRLRVPT